MFELTGDPKAHLKKRIEFGFPFPPEFILNPWPDRGSYCEIDFGIARRYKCYDECILKQLELIETTTHSSGRRFMEYEFHGVVGRDTHNKCHHPPTLLLWDMSIFDWHVCPHCLPGGRSQNSENSETRSEDN